MHKILALVGSQAYTNLILTLLLVVVTCLLAYLPSFTETRGFVRQKAIPVYVVDGSVDVQGTVSIDAQPVQVEIVK
jgi:hypothetical protein